MTEEDQKFRIAYNDPKNKRIILKLLKKYRQKYPHILDAATLESSAQFATLKAIRSYKPGKGRSFSTFLHQALQWELQSAVRSLGHQQYFLANNSHLDQIADKSRDDSDFFDIDAVLKDYFLAEKSVTLIGMERGLSRTHINNQIKKYILTQRC